MRYGRRWQLGDNDKSLRIQGEVVETMSLPRKTRSKAKENDDVEEEEEAEEGGEENGDKVAGKTGGEEGDGDDVEGGVPGEKGTADKEAEMEVEEEQEQEQAKNATPEKAAPEVRILMRIVCRWARVRKARKPVCGSDDMTVVGLWLFWCGKAQTEAGKDKEGEEDMVVVVTAAAAERSEGGEGEDKAETGEQQQQEEDEAEEAIVERRMEERERMMDEGYTSDEERLVLLDPVPKVRVLRALHPLYSPYVRAGLLAPDTQWHSGLTALTVLFMSPTHPTGEAGGVGEGAGAWHRWLGRRASYGRPCGPLA